MEKHLKVTKNQPQSSSSVSKPQIQILKNPNSKQANAQELQKQHVANATQFQTITQLNQAKKVRNFLPWISFWKEYQAYSIFSIRNTSISGSSRTQAFGLEL